MNPIKWLNERTKDAHSFCCYEYDTPSRGCIGNLLGETLSTGIASALVAFATIKFWDLADDFDEECVPELIIANTAGGLSAFFVAVLLHYYKQSLRTAASGNDLTFCASLLLDASAAAGATIATFGLDCAINNHSDIGPAATSFAAVSASFAIRFGVGGCIKGGCFAFTDCCRQGKENEATNVPLKYSRPSVYA